MVNTGKETHAPGDHPMASLESSSSNAVGFSSAQFMLLRAAIDGDLRLFHEMVICLDKGNGEAETVAAASYKGASALDMALLKGGNSVSQYLMDIGMKPTDMDDSYHTGLIIDELVALFPSDQPVEVLMPEVQWELLPSDIVQLIACTFSSAEIYVTVKSVCKRWFHALSQLPPPLALLLNTQIPFLLIPALLSGDPYKCWKLRNPNAPSRDFHFAHLALTAGNVVVGSSFGWVHVLEPETLSFFTVNPVTGEKIALPSLSRHCSGSIEPTMLVQHAVLSANPSISSSWILLVFLTAELTSCLSYRYGDRAWTEHNYNEFFCGGRDLF